MITSWLGQLADQKGHDLVVAVPGIRLTGWWPTELPDLKAFAELDKIWPREFSTILREVDIFEEADGAKHQISAYVRILSHPKTWKDLIEQSLLFFVECGAVIAWAGGWECFLRYKPSESFAGCYAAYTRDTGLICGGDLNEPFVYLNQIPGAIQRLHRAVSRHTGSSRIA